MLNRAVIREELHHDAKWFESHGSDGKEYLGGGMLYYTMAYITRAKVCVCLGSGGGFVPRLMVQAQRDLQASGMRGDGIKVSKGRQLQFGFDLGSSRGNRIDDSNNFDRAVLFQQLRVDSS